MEEKYQQAIQWAEHFLSTTADREISLKPGVHTHSLHSKINICKIRIQHSRGYAQYIAYRSIKDIKDALQKIN
jgi:hypothetical protein